jgi:hypothetical protein
MGLDGGVADHQGLGDLAVGQPASQQRQHLVLAGGEIAEAGGGPQGLAQADVLVGWLCGAAGLFVRIRAGERRLTPGAAVAVLGAQIQGGKPVPRRARGQGSSETTRAPRPGRRVRRQSSGGAACPSAKLWRKRGSRPA